MKKYLALLFGITLTYCASCQLSARQLKALNGMPIGFLEFKPPDYGGQLHPLIIFLHGIGERGASASGGTDAASALAVQANEIPKFLAQGASMKFTVNCKTFSFVVLAPQLLSTYGAWQNFYIDEMIRYAKQNLRIDTNRIYLTGLSLGGGGTWKYATTSLANATQLAAIAPVCGTCEWSNMCNTIAAANLPVWAFHAQDDGQVGVGCTNGAIATLNGCNALVKPLVTIYPTGNHWIWSKAYDTSNVFHKPNLFEWLLLQERKPTTAKAPPVSSGLVAAAGPDQSITATTATLDGSASTGFKDEWTIYWDVIEWPAGGTWNVFPKFEKFGAKVNVQNLVKGAYRFRLTVEGAAGEKKTDEVTVIVK